LEPRRLSMPMPPGPLLVPASPPAVRAAAVKSWTLRAMSPAMPPPVAGATMPAFTRSVVAADMGAAGPVVPAWDCMTMRS
jgi:hypothetical protein